MRNRQNYAGAKCRSKIKITEPKAETAFTTAEILSLCLKRKRVEFCFKRIQNTVDRIRREEIKEWRKIGENRAELEELEK